MPLGEEITFTHNYLAIERMRFGERLCIEIDVATALGDAKVPSFLLQPFVENALRHGLGEQAQLQVQISARARDSQLILRIEDDGAGLPQDWAKRTASGFGIANSRARLYQLYGGSASLEIRRRNGASGTIVDITLPLQREANT